MDKASSIHSNSDSSENDKRQLAEAEVERCRSDPRTYTEPLDPKEPGVGLEQFLMDFYTHIYFQKAKEMEEILASNPDTVEKFYRQLVLEESKLTKEDFWQRYYYRVKTVDQILEECSNTGPILGKAEEEPKRYSHATKSTMELLDFAQARSIMVEEKGDDMDESALSATEENHRKDWLKQHQDSNLESGLLVDDEEEPPLPRLSNTGLTEEVPKRYSHATKSTMELLDLARASPSVVEKPQNGTDESVESALSAAEESHKKDWLEQQQHCNLKLSLDEEEEPPIHRLSNGTALRANYNGSTMELLKQASERTQKDRYPSDPSSMLGDKNDSETDSDASETLLWNRDASQPQQDEEALLKVEENEKLDQAILEKQAKAAEEEVQAVAKQGKEQESCVEPPQRMEPEEFGEEPMLEMETDDIFSSTFEEPTDFSMPSTGILDYEQNHNFSMSSTGFNRSNKNQHTAIATKPTARQNGQQRGDGMEEKEGTTKSTLGQDGEGKKPHDKMQAGENELGDLRTDEKAEGANDDDLKAQTESWNEMSKMPNPFEEAMYWTCELWSALVQDIQGTDAIPEQQELKAVPETEALKNCGTSAHAMSTDGGNLATCLEGFTAESQPSFFRLELPTGVPEHLAARLYQVAAILRKSTSVTTVIVVVPTPINEEQWLHPGLLQMLEVIGALQGLEELSIESPNEKQRSRISTSLVTTALRGIVLQNESDSEGWLLSLTIKNMVLVDDKPEDMNDFVQAVSTIRNIPALSSTQIHMDVEIGEKKGTQEV